MFNLPLVFRLGQDEGEIWSKNQKYQSAVKRDLLMPNFLFCKIPTIGTMNIIFNWFGLKW